MKWSSDIINKIRDAHDIIEWVSHDTVLKSHSGGQYSGLCPFPDHKEKTPSFSVSSVKQVYHCFGCQRGGDLFTYFRDQKGMGFYEAVKYLAHQAGIDLKEQKSDEDLSQRNNLFQVNREAAQFFYQTLIHTPSHHAVHKYLEKRGYSREIIDKFQLGYAPSLSRWTQGLNKEKKDMALKLGLLGQKEKGFFELFRRRLMFPIISPMNQVLGFGGRSLDGAHPKYINSRDSVCFQKGRVFYGLNESASFIRQKGYVLVVEGYTDFLTLFQNGFQNVVATLGVALTSHHARLLKRYTDKVVLFFDGDSAGDQAALRSLPLLLSEGLRVHRSELKGMDPDECIQQKGVEFLKTILSKNHDLFLHVFFEQLQSVQGAERLDLVSKMVSILSSMKDQILKEYYTRKILDVFLPSEQKAVQMVLSKKDLKNRREESAPEINNKISSQEKFSLKNLPKPELYLLVLALSQVDYLEYTISKMDLKWLSHGDLKHLFGMIFEDYSQSSSNFDKLLARVSVWVEPAGWLQVQNHPILINLDDRAGKKFVQDCLSCLSLNYERSKLQNRVMQLKLKQGDERKYLKEIQDMKKNILLMEKKL